MKKLNVKNLIILVIFTISLFVVLYDITFITINIAKIGGWTLFGFVTFLLAAATLELTYEYLFENKKENRAK